MKRPFGLPISFFFSSELDLLVDLPNFLLRLCDFCGNVYEKAAICPLPQLSKLRTSDSESETELGVFQFCPTCSGGESENAAYRDLWEKTDGYYRNYISSRKEKEPITQVTELRDRVLLFALLCFMSFVEKSCLLPDEEVNEDKQKLLDLLMTGSVKHSETATATSNHIAPIVSKPESPAEAGDDRLEMLTPLSSKTENNYSNALKSDDHTKDVSVKNAEQVSTKTFHSYYEGELDGTEDETEDEFDYDSDDGDDGNIPETAFYQRMFEDILRAVITKQNMNYFLPVSKQGAKPSTADKPVYGYVKKMKLNDSDPTVSTCLLLLKDNVAERLQIEGRWQQKYNDVFKEIRQEQYRPAYLGESKNFKVRNVDTNDYMQPSAFRLKIADLPIDNDIKTDLMNLVKK